MNAATINAAAVNAAKLNVAAVNAATLKSATGMARHVETATPSRLHTVDAVTRSVFVRLLPFEHPRFIARPLRWASLRSAPSYLALLFALVIASFPAHAGPGHDHGDAPAAASANAPKRQPDGHVLLPKPPQRELGVRTLAVVRSDRPRVLDLTGTVVLDPNASGRVQSLVAGRVSPGPRGLPSPGQRVRRGDVLAYVTPASDVLERGSQRADLAEARITREHKQHRLTKLRKLTDTVPAHLLHELESEIAALAARERALSRALDSRDTLTAPVDGVVARAEVVAGQVVDARELLFEIVDPARLQIEALSYEPAATQAITDATLALYSIEPNSAKPNSAKPNPTPARVPLTLIGRAGALRGQALPLRFRIAQNAAPGLVLGQPVRVFARTTLTQSGYVVPADAVRKNPSNQDIVWVKTAPEGFTPHVVTTVPLDGANVLVTRGLEDADRVVVRAASLLNQIR
jgi:biotin carboxyl carrier protein